MVVLLVLGCIYLGLWSLKNCRELQIATKNPNPFQAVLVSVCLHYPHLPMIAWIAFYVMTGNDIVFVVDLILQMRTIWSLFPIEKREYFSEKK
jgi:hypothetical protein